MEMGTCATCAFLHDGGPRTECRFNPPQNDDAGRSRWPQVDYNDWCGRYTDGRDKHGVRKPYNRLINDGDITFLTSEEIQIDDVGGEEDSS